MVSKITSSDIAFFSRLLATMLKASVPLVQALEIVADCTVNPMMKGLTLKVRDDVSAGNSFTTALRMHPGKFDDLYCNLVDAGEQSGYLEPLLDHIATYQEKTEALKVKIRKITNYPIAVLSVAGLVCGTLLYKVLPPFGFAITAVTMMVVIAALIFACKRHSDDSKQSEMAVTR